MKELLKWKNKNNFVNDAYFVSNCKWGWKNNLNLINLFKGIHELLWLNYVSLEKYTYRESVCGLIMFFKRFYASLTYNINVFSEKPCAMFEAMLLQILICGNTLLYTVKC